MAQEYQIPSGNNPNLQTPIYDEINSIFQANETPGNQHQQRNTEKAINPISERLFAIASEIDEARKYKLDTQFFNKREVVRNRFIGDITKMIFGRVLATDRLESLTEEILKAEESSKVGAKIFGSFKQNETRREFFYDGSNNGFLSWFYHEEKINPITKIVGSVTLHYEAGHPIGNGVLRISSNPETKNGLIEGKELTDFVTATEMYHEGVMGKIYPVANIEQADNVRKLHKKVYQIYDTDNVESDDRLAA